MSPFWYFLLGGLGALLFGFTLWVIGQCSTAPLLDDDGKPLLEDEDEDC